MSTMESQKVSKTKKKLTNILKSVEGKICYQNKAQFKILHEVDGRKVKNGIFDDPVVEEIASRASIHCQSNSEVALLSNSHPKSSFESLWCP